VSAVYPAMGYDASAIGDQELIDGIEYFKTRLSGKMDFISSNLEFSDKEIKVDKYKIVTAPNGIRVGVTAVNYNTNFRYLMRTEAIKEDDVIVGKAFENLKPVLDELKEKSDLIVILAHLNDDGLIKLLDFVEGYDLVIAGNNMGEFKYARRINGKIHVQNGRDGEKIGKVVYKMPDKSEPEFESYELIKVLSRKYARDERIEKIITDLEN